METFINVDEYLNALKDAIIQKDKKRILELYDIDKWVWEKVPSAIADQYDELVDQANAICYGY